MATSNVRIGTAGWSIPLAASPQLPSGASHLARYAQRMNCAEINSSFYRSHRESTWQRWADSVPQDFQFAVKAPKTITHEQKLQSCEILLQQLLTQLRPLGHHLGPILFQLPPKLAFESKVVSNFLHAFREMHPGPAVVEPRNVSWFSDEAEALLAGHRVARCAADPAVVPAAAAPGGWPGLVYFRLHGSPRKYYSSYEMESLETIADALGNSQAAPAPAPSDRWCIFDNTAGSAALGNAITLMELTG